MFGRTFRKKKKKDRVDSSLEFSKLNKKMVIIVAINLFTNQEHLFLVGMHPEEGKRINIPFRAHKFKLNDNFLHKTDSSKEIVSPGEGLLLITEHLSSHTKIKRYPPQRMCQ